MNHEFTYKIDVTNYMDHEFTYKIDVYGNSFYII